MIGNVNDAIFCIQRNADVDVRDSSNNRTGLIYGKFDLSFIIV